MTSQGMGLTVVASDIGIGCLPLKTLRRSPILNVVVTQFLQTRVAWAANLKDDGLGKKRCAST